MEPASSLNTGVDNRSPQRSEIRNVSVRVMGTEPWLMVKHMFFETDTAYTTGSDVSKGRDFRESELPGYFGRTQLLLSRVLQLPVTSVQFSVFSVQCSVFSC